MKTETNLNISRMKGFSTKIGAYLVARKAGGVKINQDGSFQVHCHGEQTRAVTCRRMSKVAITSIFNNKEVQSPCLEAKHPPRAAYSGPTRV